MTRTLATPPIPMPPAAGGATKPWPKPRPLRPYREGWRYQRLGGAPLAGSPQAAEPLLIVLESALREAIEYSTTDMHREVGGILVGGYYRHDAGHPHEPTRSPVNAPRRTFEYVEIYGFLPATQGLSGTGNFTFTHQSWSELTRLKDQYFGDHTHCLSIGWFHTHPGIGLFLSQLDQFIQKNFFPEPWMPALVVDPRQEEFEFFRMAGSRPEKWTPILMNHRDEIFGASGQTSRPSLGSSPCQTDAAHQPPSRSRIRASSEWHVIE